MCKGLDEKKLPGEGGRLSELYTGTLPLGICRVPGLAQGKGEQASISGDPRGSRTKLAIRKTGPVRALGLGLPRGGQLSRRRANHRWIWGAGLLVDADPNEWPTSQISTATPYRAF